MIYIGIDPGKTGGISVLLPEEFVEPRVRIFPMPPTEKGISEIFKDIVDPGNSSPTKIQALIEQVHAFPGQGVTSMFTFGQGYGFLRGCLVSFGIPFIEVTPQKWMGYFGFKKEKSELPKEYKKRILQKAQNMFPNSSVALSTADSLMIAEYLRQTYNKGI